MLKHLWYKEPERSPLGAMKHDSLRQWADSVKDFKDLGRVIAESGVMRKPFDPVKVMAWARSMDFAGGARRAVYHVERCELAWLLLDKTRKVHDAFKAGGEKFYTREWQAVPWAREDWFRDSPYAYLHLLHMSEQNPLIVAYTQSIDKLLANRQTPVKPGRYLTQFFSDVLTETQIKHWAEKVVAATVPCELDYIGSNDREGWIKVYAVPMESGDMSCMTGKTSVGVYAHDKSVLRLAYITQGGEIRGRAIVREDSKEYVRCYPNTSGVDGQKFHTIMTEMVEAAGYTHGSLMGVRLAKLQYEGDMDKFVMPYLDAGEGRSPCLEDDGEYLLVTKNGYVEGQTQAGYITFESETTCDNCGDDAHEDDLTYVEAREERVCEHCLEHHYVQAWGRRSQMWVREGDTDVIECQSNNEWYLEDYANNHDVYLCEDTGEYWHLDDLVSTSRGYIHTDNAVDLDVEDCEGNNHAHKDDVVTTHDGRVIHEDDGVEVQITHVCHKDDNFDSEDMIKTERVAA
jgi:hypothetical protein